MRRILIDLETKDSLGEIYKIHNVDLNDEGIVMVLEGAARIPIPLHYDLNTSFNESLQMIAHDLQAHHGIYIGNVLDKKGYEKQSIHHFEVVSRQLAEKLQSQLMIGLQPGRFN